MSPLALMQRSHLQLVKKKSSRMNSSKCFAVYSAISFAFFRCSGFEKQNVSKLLLSLIVNVMPPATFNPFDLKKLNSGFKGFFRNYDLITVGLKIDLINFNLL